MLDKKAIIDKYLGIPFLHQGRTMEGLDCYGLIILIYADSGIKLFDIDEDYPRDWSWKGKNFFLENAHKDWVKAAAPRFLDVVTFVNSSGVMNHAGVYLGGSKFIQTTLKGTIVSDLGYLGPKRHLSGFYRYKKNDHN